VPPNSLTRGTEMSNGAPKRQRDRPGSNADRSRDMDKLNQQVICSDLFGGGGREEDFLPVSPEVERSPSGTSSSSYPDGHIDGLAAQVGNVLANVFRTELVCRTVEILRQLHTDVVRAWLRAPVA
jgi:hypothetical protein